MNQNQQELWQRLKSYEFDKAGYSFPFSAKLMRENGWTKAEALLAIEEYRRFAFLHLVADHPVSPSAKVDQVWHLHLMYTEEYWREFCGNVLQKPLHHYPSKGGANEVDKFEDWYSKTLASYEQFFGVRPNPEIWPTHNEHPRMARVELKSHWVISKPQFKRKAKYAGLGLAALTGIGCTEYVSQINPLDMMGEDFIRLYWILAVFGYLGALWSRHQIRSKAKGNQEEIGQSLSPIEVGLLRGGPVVAVNSALSQLIAFQAISFDPKSKRLRLIKPNYESNDAIEQMILSEIKVLENPSIIKIREALAPQIRQMEAQLVGRGLRLSEQELYSAKATPIGIALIAPMLGIVKLFIAYSREKPTEYLWMGVIVASLFALGLFSITAGRTELGDKVIGYLASKHWRLKQVGIRHADYFHSTALAMALFGSTAFADSPFEIQLKRMNPDQGSSSCGGSTCSSGGDGGGGGGGDGGGGCGGCGGD